MINIQLMNKKIFMIYMPRICRYKKVRMENKCRYMIIVIITECTFQNNKIEIQNMIIESGFQYMCRYSLTCISNQAFLIETLISQTIAYVASLMQCLIKRNMRWPFITMFRYIPKNTIPILIDKFSFLIIFFRNLIIF